MQDRHRAAVQLDCLHVGAVSSMSRNGRIQPNGPTAKVERVTTRPALPLNDVLALGDELNGNGRGSLLFLPDRHGLAGRPTFYWLCLRNDPERGRQS
jgi:hypothetical protein